MKRGPAAAPETSIDHHRACVLWAMVAFVVPTMGRFVFTPVLPLMQADGGLTLVDAGWLAAANHLGYLVGALTGTRLALDERTSLRLGMTGVALTVLAMAVSGPFALWFALRLAAGIAAAWAFIHISAWGLRHAMAANRPQWGGWIFMGSGISLIASGLICTAWIAASGGAAGAWLLNGTFLALITAALWPRAGEPGRMATSTATRRVVVRDRGIGRLVVAYGLGGFGYVTAATFLPVLAKAVLGAGLGYTLFWPLFGVAALSTLFIASPLGLRIGDARTFRYSLAIMAFGNAAMAWLSDAWALALGTVAIGGTFMVLSLLGLRDARRRVPPEAATTLIGRMTIAWAIGQCVGPVVSAYLAGADGRFTGALALAAVALAAASVITPPDVDPKG